MAMCIRVIVDSEVHDLVLVLRTITLCIMNYWEGWRDNYLLGEGILDKMHSVARKWVAPVSSTTSIKYPRTTYNKWIVPYSTLTTVAFVPESLQYRYWTNSEIKLLLLIKLHSNNVICFLHRKMSTTCICFCSVVKSKSTEATKIIRDLYITYLSWSMKIL